MAKLKAKYPPVLKGSLGLKAELWQSRHRQVTPSANGSLGLKAELWQSYRDLDAVARRGSLGLKAELWQSYTVRLRYKSKVRLV